MANLQSPAPKPAQARTAQGTNAPGQIRGVKPLVPIPEAWIWIWTGLIVAVAAALAYWAWRRWRRKRAIPKIEVTVPPHLRARRTLDAALQFISDQERFCVLVSGTLRIYLEECFQLDAPRRTTEEFLEELQQSAMLSLDHKRLLADFLTRCDGVKFARTQPTEVELMELHAAACRLVDETAPTAIAIPAPGARMDTPPAPPPPPPPPPSPAQETPNANPASAAP